MCLPATTLCVHGRASVTHGRIMGVQVRRVRKRGRAVVACAHLVRMRNALAHNAPMPSCEGNHACVCVTHERLRDCPPAYVGASWAYVSARGGKRGRA